MTPGTETDRRREALRQRTAGKQRVIHGRANVRYLTGYDGGGATPWLIVDDETIRLVHYSADEDSVARLAEQGVELLPFEPADDPLEVLRGALDGDAVAADLRWWAAGEATALPASTTNCSAELTALRRVKSPWEQDRLRAAGAITVTVMDRLEADADGCTGRELGARFYETAIDAGSGPSTAIPYVAVGAATHENHTTWDWHDRAGLPEEICGDYLFEFATTSDGYGVPLSRSRTGNADGQRALAAVEAGVAAVRRRLRPGADPAALHATMHSAIEGTGFRFAHRAGYSIGLGDNETWMEGAVALLGPQEREPIAAGMAFHVVGSVVEPGRFGVARSNSLLVTEDGCAELSA